MNKILLGALLGLILSAAAGAIVIASGIIDVGADVPHSRPVHQVMEFAREKSIARSAADISVPDNLNDPERVRRGAGNYDAMCIGCHLAPELADSEIRQGLYPTPPNLSRKRAALPPEQHAAREFWIIKHGIKATGMPAWSKGGMEDEAIWDLVAFLQEMPALSKAAYGQLVAASDGHSHGGMEGGADGERQEAHQPGLGEASAHDHSKHKH